MRPNPNNPRKISDKKLKMMAKSLHEFGDLSGVVHNLSSGTLVGGHQRIKIMGDLPPVITQKYKKPTRTGTLAEGYIEYEGERFTYREVKWGPEKETAAMIAANNQGGENDFAILSDMITHLDSINLDLDLIGLDEKEIENIMTYSPKEHPNSEIEDNIPETKENELGVKTGDLWILGNHRLLCGDATSKEDVERLMDGQKADFCFTSPPYSDQRDYNGDLNLDPKHLAKFLTHNCDIFAVNLGYARKDKEVFPYWQDYIDVAKSNGLKLLSWNVWDRGLPFSIGQQTAMFPIEHEWIFVFGKDTVDLIPTVDNKHAGAVQSVTNRQKDGSMSSSKKYSVRDKRSLGTICRNHVDRESNIKHPAKFPVSLVQSYIEAFSGKTILEPFCGSGSTLIACEKTQRRCFGMEIDPHYCSVIIKRWETFTGKKAHKFHVKRRNADSQQRENTVTIN